MIEIVKSIYTTKIYNNKITIPVDIRKKFNLSDGDGIIFEIKNRTIIIKKNEESKITL